ncbi:alpha/beta fold hydrolase [Trichothermofontia sp.]
MTLARKVLWLNLSRHLGCLHRPLLRELVNWTSVLQWDYVQGLDEPASLAVPLGLLREFLVDHGQPVHLAGHGLSGALGLLYARQYPEQVASLTLLGVGPQPDHCWQSCYYAHRRLLRCDRALVLSIMVSQLFGESVRSISRELVGRLQRDLDETPSPHSLLYQGKIAEGSAPVPLLICGSQDDAIVGPERLSQWQTWLHTDRGDRMWSCPSGRHFFHYCHAKLVCRVMVPWWQQQEALAADGQQVSSARSVSADIV